MCNYDTFLVVFIYALSVVLLFSIKRKTGQVSSKIWFYSIGLGDTNKTDKRGWKILPLEMIKKELGHTQVRITYWLSKGHALVFGWK